MARRSVYGLLGAALLAGGSALAAEQLLFLGYDLRGLIERAPVGADRSPRGLAYIFTEDADWQPQLRLRLDPGGFRLRYEIGDLVERVTPPTLARHRL